MRPIWPKVPSLAQENLYTPYISPPKNETFQIKNSDVFSYFCSKHRLWVLVRIAYLQHWMCPKFRDGTVHVRNSGVIGLNKNSKGPHQSALITEADLEMGCKSKH